MKRRGSLLTVVMTAMALSAGSCGNGATAPEPLTVSGSWSGTSQGVTLNLVLLEGVGGGVSGSGNLVGSTDNLALVVRQGTHADPNLTLVLGATGYQDMNFSARLTSANEMAGTLNGSGFDNFNLNLMRR
jgi:hypothetical protein